MKIFTVAAFKGGSSKSTSTLHIGAAIAKFHKKRVLLIDFDSQANLSIALGFGPDSLKTSLKYLPKIFASFNVRFFRGEKIFTPSLNN